jgi:chemotaxis protein MotB
MKSQSWAAVAGCILLAGIVASAIFFHQRNDAREQWRESRDQIKALEHHNAELKASLENQTAYISAGRRLAERKQAALTAAETQISELKAQLASGRTEVEAVHIQVRQAQEEMARLKGELASAEVRVADLTNESNQLDNERKNLTLRLEGIKAEAVQKAASIAMLEQQVREGDEWAVALESNHQALRDTMVVREKQLADAQGSLRGLQTDAEGLRKELATMKASAEELNARQKALTDERDDLLAQTTTLKAENGDLRASIAEMETRHGDAVSTLNEKITALSSALEAKDERLHQLEEDRNRLTSELKAANLKTTELRDQLQDLVTRVPALKDRLEKSLDNYQTVRADLTEAQVRKAQLEARQQAMRETYEALVAGLKQQLDSQEASIKEYREKLEVTFVDRVLFGFSQVRISPEGKAALDRLAEALVRIPEGKISVIGHADNIPVATQFRFRFPSNWELSSARAGVVARYILSQADLDPSRIEVVGLSRHHPVADNDTEAGRAKNRRVEIIITPGRSPD